MPGAQRFIGRNPASGHERRATSGPPNSSAAVERLTRHLALDRGFAVEEPRLGDDHQMNPPMSKASASPSPVRPKVSRDCRIVADIDGPFGAQPIAQIAHEALLSEGNGDAEREDDEEEIADPQPDQASARWR